MNEFDRNTTSKTEFIFNLTFVWYCASKITSIFLSGTVTCDVNCISNCKSTKAGF